MLVARPGADFTDISARDNAVAFLHVLEEARTGDPTGWIGSNSLCDAFGWGR